MANPWMARALRLASTVAGTTWPNPGVGCVLERDGVLLGQGTTAPRQGDLPQVHAEVAALADAHRRGHDPRGCTAHVTLAPCTRRSTGGISCADALIQAGVARVVVAVEDPHQMASIAHLDAAGLAVSTGPGEAAARHLHGGFLTRMVRRRPRFTGKWAMTLDGCLAAHTGHSGWISDPLALDLSRRRRRAFDAILIGGGTARHDDPSLLSTAPRRRGADATPLRIVVARDPALAEDARLLTTLDQAPLLVVQDPATPVEALAAWGAQVLPMEDLHDVVRLGQTLGAWGLNEVLVEGGSRLHGAFLRAGLYDRLEIYQGGLTLGGGLPIAAGTGVSHLADAPRWRPEVPPRLLGSTVLSRWTCAT